MKATATALPTLLLALAPAIELHPLRGCGAAQDLEHVLESARAARGPAPAALVVLEGKCEHLGLDGDFTYVLGPTGEFRWEVTGPLGIQVAFDGETMWSREWTNPTRKLAGSARDSRLLQAWTLAGHWTRKGAPLEIALAGEQPDEGGVTLRLAPKESRLAMQLVVDRETWLPRVLRRENEGAVETWEYEAWRATGATRFPHRIVHTDGGGLRDVYEVREAREVPLTEGSEGRFVVASAGLGDTRFHAERPARIEVERADTGHLLVHPEIDGEDVGWFIFDSGAGGMCVDPGVGDELGMEAFGQVTATGAGGRTTARFRRGESFALGPIEVADPIYVELDLAFLEPFFGVEIAGIVGYDLFARSVVEIEVETDSILIHDREGYELPRGGWQELLLDNRLPSVRCTFEGDRAGVFRIDTGAMGTVHFHAPAVEELGLLDGRKTSRGVQGGVGGMVTVATGDIEWFEVGGRRFEAPSASFGLGEGKGAMADDMLTGTIGTTFLEPFRLVFDYQGERLAFVPLEAEPE